MEKNLSISDVLSRALDIVKKNAGFLIVTPILYRVASQMVSNIGSSALSQAYLRCLPQLLNGSMDVAQMSEVINAAQVSMLFSPMFYIGMLLSWALMVFYNVGYSRFQLQGIDGVEMSANSFVTTFETYLQYFLAWFLSGLIIGVGLVCCVLPGIYLAVRLCVAPYYVVDRGMNCITAIQTCWRDMKGNWWMVFLATIVFGLVNLGGLLCCCLGCLFTGPLTAMALALVYRAVSSNVSVAEGTVSDGDNYLK